MNVARHLRPPELVGVPLEEIMKRYVGGFRDRKADRGGDALAQRSGRGLDAGDEVVFGMPRRLAAELAESLDVVQRYRGRAELLEREVVEGTTVRTATPSRSTPSSLLSAA